MSNAQLEPWRLEKADEECWRAWIAFVQASEAFMALKRQALSALPTDEERALLTQSMQQRAEARTEIRSARVRAAMGKVFDELFPDEPSNR